MGCGSSASNKVQQETDPEVTTKTVRVQPAAAPATANSTDTAEAMDSNETAAAKSAQAASSSSATEKSNATPYAARNESPPAADFHSITVPEPGKGGFNSGLGSPKKSKKITIAAGIGRQASTRDLSKELSAVSSIDSTKGLALFDSFLRAIHLVSAETNRTRASEIIIEETCKILDCSRATLFLVDEETDELEMVVAKGAKNLRMPRSKGIAGHVATTGETVLLSDAHQDSRFDPSHDKATGFRTRAVVACPIRDKEGLIVGVLMCINKNSIDSPETAVFTPLDKVLAENFASHTGLILRNCELYEASRAAARKVETLLDIVQVLHSDPNISSLIFNLTNRAHTLVDADRSTLYLLHKPTNTLVVQQGNIDIRVPITKGIAGHVASTGSIVNIKDCYQDERFDQSIDKKTGYRTRAMLCMPIRAPKASAANGSSGANSGSSSSSTSASSKGEVIGVLQVINKKDDSEFREVDERLLYTLLDLSGPILAASSFFAQQSAPVSEFDKVKGTGSSPRKNAAGTSSLAGVPIGSTTLSKPVGGGSSGAAGGRSKPRGAASNIRRITEAEIEAMDPEEVARLRELAEDEEEEEEELMDVEEIKDEQTTSNAAAAKATQ